MSDLPIRFHAVATAGDDERACCNARRRELSPLGRVVAETKGAGETCAGVGATHSVAYLVDSRTSGEAVSGQLLLERRGFVEEAPTTLRLGGS
jgi:hypothetical protein